MSFSKTSSQETVNLTINLNPDQVVRMKLQELRLKELINSPWQKFQFDEHPELLSKLAQHPIPEWEDLLSNPKILEIYNQSSAIKKIRDKFGKANGSIKTV